MYYWEEFIATFPSEHREAIRVLIELLQARFGIQEFEAFADLPPETLVLEMFPALPDRHPYRWNGEIGEERSEEERLKIAEELLSRARHLLENPPNDQEIGVEVSLHFTATSGDKTILAREVAEKLSPEEVDILMSIEPQLLDWLAETPENAARFALDPVAALEQAKLLGDRHLLKKLGRIRRERLLVEPSLPGVRLASLTVDTVNTNE